MNNEVGKYDGQYDWYKFQLDTIVVLKLEILMCVAIVHEREL